MIPDVVMIQLDRYLAEQDALMDADEAFGEWCDDTGQDRDDSDAFNAWQADMDDRRTDDLIEAAEWDRMYPEVVA